MLKKIRFPIRFKILLTLLVVITMVVSMITFIMANLFHADKTTYIKDLTVTIASNQAEKTRVILEGYRKELSIFSQLMLDRSIPSGSRNRLLQKAFVNFKEFVAVTLYQPERDPVTIFDDEALTAAGLDRSFLDQSQATHPLPLQEIRSGRTYIINATLHKTLPLLLLAINPEDGPQFKLANGAGVGLLGAGRSPTRPFRRIGFREGLRQADRFGKADRLDRSRWRGRRRDRVVRHRKGRWLGARIGRTDGRKFGRGGGLTKG